MAYRVFISHTGEDTWVAKQIALHLLEIGASTFLDASNIYAGDQFEEIIFEEIKGCNELIVLLTPRSLDRPYIYMEIGAARMLEMRIVIVLYGISNEEILNNIRLPQIIKGSNIISINGLDEYFSQVQKRLNLNS